MPVAPLRMRSLQSTALSALLLLSSPLFAEASVDAQVLTRRLRIQDFEKFLHLPPRVPREITARVDERFGLDRLLDRVAAHFDAHYTPGQIRSMVALFDDPNMQAVVRETVGSEAPVNKLLSEWVRQRSAYLQQLDPASISRTGKK